MAKHKLTCACGKPYIVSDEHAGKQFACKSCGAKLKIPAAADADDGLADFSEDDYGEPAAALPPARKKSSTTKKPKGKSSSSDKSAGPSKQVLIGAGMAGVGVLLVGGFFAVRAFTSGEGAGTPAAAAAPVEVKYVKLRHEVSNLGAEYPEGWKVSQSGGTGGKPTTMRFTDDTAMISCRESEAGSALGDIAKLAGDGADEPDQAPVAAVHRHQLFKMEDEYGDYKESAAEVKEVRLGEARLAKFTASEGFSAIAGYRMTVLNNLEQYNIVCKCPKSKLAQYEPIFQHVLSSFER